MRKSAPILLLCAIGAVAAFQGAEGVGTVETDVPYVADGDAKQKLDLYLPPGKGFATVVFVHGGAWVAGDRKSPGYPALARNLQALGYGCAVISYRLSPGVKHPAHSEDAAAAFAWVKKNIASRGGDADKVFLMGHSAGGHMAALLATDPKYLARHGLKLADVRGCIPIGAVLEIDAPNALIGRNGALGTVFPGDRSALRDASPMAHLGRSAPPMLVMVAERDILLLKLQADRFVEAAKKAEARVEFFEMPDRNHMTTIPKLAGRDDAAVKRLLEFLGGR